MFTSMSTAVERRLQLAETSDGEVIGLLPGQQLMSFPNGLVTIVNSNQTNFIEQAGASILASCVAPGVLTDATGTAMTSKTVLVRSTVDEGAEEEDDTSPQPSKFVVGDYVKLNPEFAVQKARSPQFAGLYDAMSKLSEAVGTVQIVSAPMIAAKFKSLYNNRLWSCESANLVKLNKYSVNQVIQIRSDASTIQQIDNQFQPHQSERLKGAIGYVSGIDQNDPSGKLFIKFDDNEVCDESVPLPSVWMEAYETAHSATDTELLEQASKQVTHLFFKAVDGGNFRAAKLLYSRNGVDPEARKRDGKTALHLACFKGHYDIVKWLLDKAKVDMSRVDNRGFSAIHYAILGCNADIIELLLKEGASVDSQTLRGETALHFALLHQTRDCSCFRLLSAYKANPNLQDTTGNTPLHFAIMKGRAYQMLRHFSFDWGLRNQKGLNIIQQAVLSNDLSTVQFILAKNELCQPLFELLPDGQSTVLHYACANKNYQMAKLLVGESEDFIMLDKTDVLGNFLEAQNESGKTALLIACRNMDYSIVDLLIEAGANVKAVDKDGNTTILLATSDPVVPQELPTIEFSPKIFQVYQSALGDSADSKMLMKRLPILSLVAYLMVKGSSLEAANKAGISGTDAVLSKGSSTFVLNMLAGLVVKSLADATDGMSCMGRNGCAEKPGFHLSCPHKQACNICSKCLLTCENLKHGCPEEDVTPLAGLQQLMDLSRIQAGKQKEATNRQPIMASFVFQWIRSTGTNGSLRDQMGNKYTHWNESASGDSHLYRCDKGESFKDRCPAVARRFKNEDGSTPTISLVAKHNHPVRMTRNNQSVKNPEGGPIAGPSRA